MQNRILCYVSCAKTEPFTLRSANMGLRNSRRDSLLIAPTCRPCYVTLLYECTTEFKSDFAGLSITFGSLTWAKSRLIVGARAMKNPIKNLQTL